MEIKRYIDSSSSKYPDSGTFILTPRIPPSSGGLRVVCTDRNQHPSRELARGDWVEVSSHTNETSTVFWARPVIFEGQPRFVPQVRVWDEEFLDEEGVVTKRGDELEYSPSNYYNINNPKYLDDLDVVEEKREFRCPTCKRCVVLTGATLGLHALAVLLGYRKGHGDEIRIDISIQPQVHNLVPRDARPS